MTTQNRNGLLTRVNATVDLLRPFLQSDGGDIIVEEITDDYVVKVRLIGACSDCQFSFFTLKAGVEEAIRKEIPEIKEVIAIQ